MTTTLEAAPFSTWIARIRAGDADAAAELIKRFERPVRVAVRARLTDVRLRRQFDSMDVVQSVMGSFFTRMTDGQFDLENPSQLVGLLMKMAQNKLLMQVRRHKQKRRDVTRTEVGSDDAPPIPDAEPGPERQAIGRELLQLLYDRLTDDERDLALRRAGGQQWTEIAGELGGTPQGHRMKLSRAVARVSPGLGFDDTDPDAST
jgi:RNA polymerase sigma factor (sigma-70 family)